ncbi:glycosyl transferase family A [Gallibacterium genomosp. 3]|uniref:Glycosyl transferase family A n=1 Tax=Gallibacterium genomosp. 3 TaxID=505345 RepID=A0A1A7PT25_9PAST|nr:glycosyltransferase family 2 protein [Gallibacterium genomosp. 3]OBX04310.1 glycosyl transferase family A [Gallibacterium genomosp. 3]
MKDYPLVSIITPVYNAELYIKDCIESIINQTYPHWELLLVDDCSQDGSINIIKSYILKDKRIKLFKNSKNLGPAGARNIALKNAHGKYITFLDSDDFILKDKIEKQVNFMISNQIKFSHGNYSFYNITNSNIKNIRVENFIDYKILLKGNQFKIMTVMIDRDILSNQIFSEVAHEDFLFFLNILEKGYKSQRYSEEYHSICRINIRNSVSFNKLKSAIWTWRIYRVYLNLGLLASIYYFVHYIIKGIKKYS